MISEHFDPSRWTEVEGQSFTDITYHRAVDQGTVRIAFDRPEVRNAFRPQTVDELYRGPRSRPGDPRRRGGPPHRQRTLTQGRRLGVLLGRRSKDQGADGYQYSEDETAGGIDQAKLGRLHILECQRLIRFMPKIVIAVVPGWAVGGGHSLHVVCDLTIACNEHALFKQTDSDVASFDGGFGSAYLARMVGQKRAREIFFLGHAYTR